jgi:hypothetical protein
VNKLKDMTDLELAQAQGQLYPQLMQVQQNLIAINKELENRAKLKKQEKDGKEEGKEKEVK